MNLIKHDTREHKLILKVFAHSSKVEKKVMMNVASAINKLNISDWKGKMCYPIEIPMPELMERTESNYKAIYRVCEKIADKKIRMKIPYKIKNGKTEIFDSVVCVFPECGISENIFRIEVKETVLPLFSRALEIYRHYNIIEAKFLKHKHSIELYKFLKDKLNQGKPKFTIPLKNLKTELGLEDKYKEYKNFKMRVLEPSKLDMKSNGIFWFEYKELKKNRRVSEFQFTIHEEEHKRHDLYANETLKQYLKSESETQFKKDFTTFLEKLETYTPKLKTLLDELETKKSLAEYTKEMQYKFINFIAPDLGFQL